VSDGSSAEAAINDQKYEIEFITPHKNSLPEEMFFDRYQLIAYVAAEEERFRE